MRRILLYIPTLLIGLLTGQFTSAQFDYFNMSIGLNESSSNVEVVGNEYIVMGLDETGTDDCWFFRRYDQNGTLLAETCYFFPGELHYLGLTNSFQKVPDQNFYLHTQGLFEDGQIKGSAMLLDLELDTIWRMKYDTYAPETYFTTHTWDGNGWILAGEHGPEAGERGTFIMKIDTLGEVLWHELIHEPSEGIFRNLDISVVEGGYVWSGAEGVLSETEGYIEFVNDNLESELLLTGQDGVERLAMRHFQDLDGGILAIQSIGQAYIDGGPSTYRTMQISRLNFGTSSLELLADFEPYSDWINAYGEKMIRLSSGEGYVILGLFNQVPNDGGFSYLSQFDSDFQNEWYTELYYDDCPTCENILYDIEKAPDGGYIMVGEFRDTSIDFNPRTWLVKVDACGDLEWMGCEPVGTEEWEVQSNFYFYPNPAVDELNIESQTNREWDEILITNILGQELQRERIANSKINVMELGTGIYVISLYSKGLPVHSQKFMKE